MSLFRGLLGSLFVKDSKSIKVNDLNKAMNDKNDFKGVVLDVRTPKEVESGILSGAVVKNAFSKEIKEFVKNLDPSRDYYVYCHSGVRSLGVVKLMNNYDIKGINISGGISAWKKAGYPIVDKGVIK